MKIGRWTFLKITVLFFSNIFPVITANADVGTEMLVNYICIDLSHPRQRFRLKNKHLQHFHKQQQPDIYKYCRHVSYSGPSNRAIDYRSSPARWTLPPNAREVMCWLIYGQFCNYRQKSSYNFKHKPYTISHAEFHEKLTFGTWSNKRIIST